MLALKLTLKNKCGKQHCIPFFGSSLGVEIYLKKKTTAKKGRCGIEAPLKTLYWGFKKILSKACLLFLKFC